MTFPDGWIELPPCATEDSADCYWDASLSGNGTGHSFIEYAGTTVQIPDMPNHYVDLVLVNPVTFDPQNHVGHFTVLQERDSTPTPTPSPEATTTQTAQPVASSTIPAPDLSTPTLLVVAAFIVALIALVTLPLFRKKAS